MWPSVFTHEMFSKFLFCQGLGFYVSAEFVLLQSKKQCFRCLRSTESMGLLFWTILLFIFSQNHACFCLSVIVSCMIHCGFPCIFWRNAAEPMVPCPADYSHVYVELGIFISSPFFFFSLNISAVCQGHSEKITGLISFWNKNISSLHPNHWGNIE